MNDTVEVVIKIPKKCKKFLDKGGKVDWLDAIPIIDAVANGTVLPKGHDDLIERSQVTNYNNLYEVPVVIKADKGEN